MTDLYAFPVSFSQQRLWVADQLLAGSPAYLMPAALLLEGELQVEALKRALAEIVNRHESLRTTFGLREGQPVQLVSEQRVQELPVIELHQLPEAMRRERAEKLVAEEAVRPFDLERGSLLRTTLLKLAEREHLLLITMHHIISDGWSTGILIEELSALYGAFVEGKRSPLPELPFQYADFSEWQHEAMRGEELAQSIDYWRDRLAGELPLLQLPFDRPRHLALTDRGGAVKRQLSKELTEQLKEVGRKEQATLFMTLLAAYQVFLSRYSGQEDVLVGSPIAGRYLQEVEPLIGFFVNNLVLRGNLANNPSFEEFLVQVRLTALQAYRHQEVPFEKLVQELQPERHMNVSPLFQTMFTLNSPLAKFELPGLSMRLLEQETRAAKYDLLLEMVEEADGLVCKWEYKTDLFDRETIERMASNFEVLLQGIVHDPSASVSALPLLSADEYELVVDRLNRTERDYPQDLLLHQFFERQAERTPDRAAVVFEGESISYRELNERANRLAARLRREGVRGDSFVGIFMERSIELVVAVCGVLKAGGAYVPIDPALPAERVDCLLADSQVRVLLTHGQLAERISEQQAAVICVDGDSYAAEEASDLEAEITPDHLAYMLYTSGSTGQPKGAMITHRAAVNHMLWRQEEYGLTEADRVLQKTPISFDVSVWELFWTLAAGSTLVVARADGHKDSAYLRDLIIEQQVTTVHFVPSMFQIFLEEKGVERCKSLRHVYCGGEALLPEQRDRFYSRLPHAQLHNLYGPTEATIDVTYWRCEQHSERPTIPIGRPLANTKLYVLDAHLNPVPLGATGELHVAGVCLARGYHNREELTASRFIANPFGEGKLYKTGDLVRLASDGVIEYRGRLDDQVKIRGYRIELGEVESPLVEHPSVKEAVVLQKGDSLSAFIVAKQTVTAKELRRFLLEKLPSYMVPNTFSFLAALPLSPNGKVDRRALLELKVEEAVQETYLPPQSELEREIALIWQEVLGVKKVGLNDNFFDLGGHSLLLIQVHRQLKERYDIGLSVVEMFKYPTVSMLANHLFGNSQPSESKQPRVKPQQNVSDRSRTDIAVIGMAGRFPGAKNVEEFWHNLRDGVESIEQFSKEELLEVGHDPKAVEASNYVRAAGILEDIEWFDAGFFGINPREAEVMDPQHRIFLETAWEALEVAGYDSENYEGVISVFAGTGLSRYLMFNLLPNQELIASVGELTVALGNENDHLAARVAYKLNLKGVSHGVASACSTALLSIHLASQNLRNGDCDMAIAGGISVGVPQKTGYHHVEGGIMSPDGHCRAFDANAQGTVPGSGTGVVVLKRLDDALRDGDHIMAVVKGSAVNNDGSQKVGYTAPSVEGQAQVIAKALDAADVHPESVSYVEGHGTATPLGDPIELTALTQAYRTQTDATNFCAIGSVKSNIGHLDAAAGAAGFMKTVLALYHQQLPPSLHFEAPTPKVDWRSSPFYVNTELKQWQRGDSPRRAGVSSFGLGGNNVHAILEEAPQQVSTPSARGAQLLVLSAKTTTALETATANLKEHLLHHPEQALDDIAYTLQVGRRAFEHRRTFVVTDREDALEVLSSLHPRRMQSGQSKRDDRSIAFLFPGTGDQYVNMAQELYRTEPTFKTHVDTCCKLLKPQINIDLRDLLYPEARVEPVSVTADCGTDQAFDLRKLLRRDGETQSENDPLARTEYLHPALFVIEYALAQLLLEWGIRPKAMIGYSLGEYVAACLAGVFSLEDALTIVAKRAQLIQQLPAGAMLGVSMSAADILPLLGDRLSLAAINTPHHCVVSGEADAMDELEQQLLAQGIACMRVQNSHAFHSQMMEPIVDRFAELIGSFRPNAPRIPFVSNVTGEWITAEQASDPMYWARHLCQTVRLADGLQALCQDEELVLLEVGPGQTLCSFALQGQQAGLIALPTLRPSYEKRGDLQFLLGSIGQLWISGGAMEWQGMHQQERRLRVPLPTYPFERKRFWIEAKSVRSVTPAASVADQHQEEEGSLQLHARPHLSTPFATPTNEQEATIVRMYQELLGIDGVGVHDNFFQLGGNSLIGMQLISRLRGEYEIELPLSALFEALTAAELAVTVQEKISEKGEVPTQMEAVITPRPEGRHTLSSSQERIWFMEQLAPGEPVYNIPTAVRMKGKLNLDLLTKSINEIISRHETLRTIVKTVDGQPIAEILPELRIAIAEEDISSHDASDRNEEANRLVSQLAREPFDLHQGPLIRATVFRLGEEEHVLALIIHHIVADGWSLGLLIREIGALYSAFYHGEPSPLSPLAIQYGDYAHWLEKNNEEGLLDGQLSYWKERMSGQLETLMLPTDRPRPVYQTYNGAMKMHLLSPEFSEELQQLSTREGTTLYMTLLSAFNTFLARYSGQTDIMVGTPMANRKRREVEDLIGVFINTLVLRNQVTSEMTFRELLQQVRLTTLDAFANQELPFEKLVQELKPDRNMSFSLLFQVMFIMQSTSVSLSMPGLEIESEMLDDGTAKFDITLLVRETDHGLLTSWEYNTDLYDESTIEQMIAHFDNLLRAIVADPGQKLHELPLASVEEQEQMLFEWNETQVDHREDLLIHQLFEEQVERTPEATAVVFEAERLTFRELNNRANQLAHQLQAHGVGTDQLVGIFLDRSLEMVVALLATLKAGGAYLPLDPSYPQDRLQHMIEDAKLAVILTQASLADALPPHEAELIMLSEGEQVEILSNPVSQAKPEHLAYVIFTSGSTGKPKGVMIEHRNVVNFMAAMDERIRLAEQDVMLAVTSIGFDISVLELFWTLTRGTQVVLLSEQEVIEAGMSTSSYSFWAQADRHQVTMLQCTPSLMSMLLASEQSGAGLQKLQKILLGGEELPLALARQLRACTDAQLFNMYGPTEATVWATVQEVREVEQAPIPLGRPLANYKLYILDNHFQPVPVGVAGELYIGGASVARGYLDRPDLTEERFLNNPFAEGKLYKTGDLASYSPDGTVKFLGRLDHQVKVRGHRIELGEIETKLETHDAIRQAVVISRNNALIAYAVCLADELPELGELRSFLRKSLPDYMVPSAFVRLDALPLTPNGKVDRKALPTPEGIDLIAEASYVPPSSPLELALTGIWRDVLDLEKVGVRDNFFVLGGHSLLATRAMSRLNQQLSVQMPLKSLFDAPTIAELAALIETNRQGEPVLKVLPITAVGREGQLPLSFAQERLWFLDQFDPASSAYNIPVSLRLQGELDAVALAKSFRALVERHESLRTVFVSEEGQPIQIIQSDLTLEMSTLDLQDLPEQTREEQMKALAIEEARKPFDLAQGPLVRATLLRIRPDEHLLLLTMHHIVTDEWSMGILVDEMVELYRGYAAGSAEQQLPALPLQYVDYSAWQREWLQGDVLQGQLQYWKQKLGGKLPLLQLPTDYPRPDLPTLRGAQTNFSLDSGLTEKLSALSSAEGATLYMTLLSAFNLLLHRYSRQEDILVGSPIAGRMREELEGMIGLFVNTLVLRTDLSGAPTFRELLARVRQTALEAYVHQEVPFEKLVEVLQPERNLNQSPLFQVMFTLQNAPKGKLDVQGLTLTPEPLESGTAKFDLTLTLVEDGDRLQAEFEYSTDLFAAETIERMGVHFCNLLAAIVSDPDQRIDELAFLSEAERLAVLAGSYQAGDYDREATLHSLFERQVAKTPDATAVVYEDQVLTYRELNEQANRLAHHLQTLGAGPDVPIGIFMERSHEWLVSILAVLKAGGAYLPLDPTYPNERMQFMLEDAQAPVVLTKSALTERLSAAGRQVLAVDQANPAWSGCSAADLDAGTDSTGLAYIIYTSGTTGKPKGVLVPHRGVVSLLTDMHNRKPLQVGDRSSVWTSFGFDVSVYEMFTALLYGAAVCLASDEVRYDSETFIGWLVQQEITSAYLPPYMVKDLASWLEAGNGTLSLHRLLVGVEPLSEKLLATIAKRVPGLAIFNGYGPTETTIFATAYQIDPEHAEERQTPIGKPMANTAIYLLDAHGQLVPNGIAGELCIGGDLVVRGYLNRPELTAERFVADPFAEQADARMYRTGDLARRLPDGNIMFLGRMDSQVKIRGFRVELGEIEAQLIGHPSVREAVVIVKEINPDDKRLIAYLVASAPQEELVPELRALLSEHLPSHMMPAAFLLLDALPLTPNGKIDRKALPEPDFSSAGKEREYVAPSTPTEQKLAELWSKFLQVEQIGIHDNFFEIGGHSLLATQLIASVQLEFQVELSLRELFEKTTIAELAMTIEAAERIETPQIQRRERAGAVKRR